MPNNIWILENIGGTATSYYLSASSTTPYTGSGTPWTSQSTTPIKIAMNDVTGPRWTPQAPMASQIFAGGPPFNNGSDLLSRAYPNDTEQIPIQIYASNANNAIAVLTKLRLALKSNGVGLPPILAVQPNTTTNVLYFQILDGDIQETTRFTNEEAGRGILRAVMTLVCKPFGGRLSNGETLINAVTYANNGTGSPNNLTSLGTGAGDYIREGSPLNISVTPTTVGADINTLYAASVYSRVYGALASVIPVTVGPPSFSTGAVDFSAAVARPILRGRMLWRFSSISPSTTLQLVLRGSSSGSVLWRSAAIVPSATGAQIIDFGAIPLNILQNIAGVSPTALYFDLYVYTTAATSASLELLLYYDFATISTGVSTGASEKIFLSSFQERTDNVALPITPTASILGTSSALSNTTTFRGTLPRYFEGSSLYLAWARASGLYTATDQATVTATHGPLWRTLRGAL